MSRVRQIYNQGLGHDGKMKQELGLMKIRYTVNDDSNIQDNYVCRRISNYDSVAVGCY